MSNKSTATAMRTWCKKVLKAVEDGDKNVAEELLPTAIRGIDKAAKANVIHDNTAARKKSQMDRLVAGMTG